MLTVPERDSLVGASVLVGACFALRRHIFSKPMLRGFLIANVIFGFIGIFILPWALDNVFLSDELDYGFGFIDWSLISENDLSRTIEIYVGGFLLVLLAHRVTAGLETPGASAHQPAQRDLHLGRLVALAGAALLFAAVYVRLHPEVFLAGLQTQLMGEEKGELYDYRYAAGTISYPFVLVSFNILPFLSTALWLRVRSRPASLRLLLFTILCVAVTGFVSVLTFQKMPLMIFAIGIALTEVGVARGQHRPYGNPRRWLGRAAWLLSSLLFLVSILQGVMRGGEAASSPVLVSVLEIFGRISAGAPLFVAYFPAVEPHYGLANVGMVASLLGDPVYPTSALVFRYFCHQDIGSAALGSLLDFYCAFGWAGWFLGCLLLGVFLALMDKAILRIPEGEARLLAIIFAFTFCMHLAQASIFNAAFGYGGAFFLALWFIVFPARRALASRSYSWSGG